VFTGSADIGGADADFILGGLLLDCKSTVTPYKPGTAEIYQLAGYLLLDYDDQYGIRRVGAGRRRDSARSSWGNDIGSDARRIAELMTRGCRAAG
jgi:hypothetical protein